MNNSENICFLNNNIIKQIYYNLSDIFLKQQLFIEELKNKYIIDLSKELDYCNKIFKIIKKSDAILLTHVESSVSDNSLFRKLNTIEDLESVNISNNTEEDTETEYSYNDELSEFKLIIPFPNMDITSLLSSIDKRNTNAESKTNEAEQNLSNYDNYSIFYENLNIYNTKPFDEIYSELRDIFIEMGSYSLDIGLKIFLGDNYKIYFNSNIIKYIDYLNNVFVPIKYIIENNDSELSNDLITSDLKNEYIEKNNNSLVLKRYGSEIKLVVNNFIITCVGYFKLDSLEVCKRSAILLHEGIKEKLLITEKYINSESEKIPQWFKNKFLKKLSIRDYLCLSQKKVGDLLEEYYILYTEIDKRNINKVIEMFILSSLERLLKIIEVIVMFNTDKRKYSKILIDVLKTKKVTGNSVHDIIYSCLNIRQRYELKINKSSIENELSIIKDYDPENLNVETKLALIENIPKNVKKMILDKHRDMKRVGNEAYKQTIFINFLLDFPWKPPSKLTLNSLDFDKINKDFDKKIYGHSDEKKTIMRVVGKWAVSTNGSAPCIGLCGPPGVGKTHFSRSLGEILDLPFIQINLGGQNDVEYLIGHGYTYTSSQPGMLIRKISEHKSNRCIIFFDELDKISSKHNNFEISAVLTHLTDPESNKCFQDRFFQGIDFDLSNHLLIFSYNDARKIDPILLDRITQIDVEEYTKSEKLKLSKDFLIPEVLKEYNLDKDKIMFYDSAVEYIIDEYTLESGVRGLKKCFQKIFGSINLEILTNEYKGSQDFFIITKKTAEDYLEESDLHFTKINELPLVGMVNGMYASTSHGGITFIQVRERITNDSKFELKLTGSQGDVMKESVQVAYTVACEIMYTYDSNWEGPCDSGYHIHCPSGATPKDGPSAGCAFVVAFMSVFTNKKVFNDVSITGEVELTHKSNKIGGVYMKLTGALRAGVTKVLIPEENRKDYKKAFKRDSFLDPEKYDIIFYKTAEEACNHLIMDY